jgi:hypothetical protein
MVSYLEETEILNFKHPEIMKVISKLDISFKSREDNAYIDLIPKSCKTCFHLRICLIRNLIMLSPEAIPALDESKYGVRIYII